MLVGEGPEELLKKLAGLNLYEKGLKLGFEIVS